MKKLITLLFILTSLIVFGQGEANFWFFGRNAGLDFNSGTPIPISGSLSTYEGCASFSDRNGNLLFYTDGTSVWDKNDNLMPNGTNLKGNSSSSQSAIIVPHPGKPTIFYIFTVGASISGVPTQGLNCYTVDMTANSGLGDIIGVPIDLSYGLNAQWTEKVTSVKGADCNTFWVVSLVQNTYYSYKIDDRNGLNPIPVLSPVNYFSSDRRGYLKVSPDGKKLASAFFTQYNETNGTNVVGNGKLILYNFNDLTGVVSNNGIEVISNAQLDGAPYGVEFSPLSSKLYISTFDGFSNKLFQYDLQNSNIIYSKYLVNSQIGYRGALQLAPNGKIYATVPPNYNNGTNNLNAINLPDELGVNCNFQLNALNLGTGYAMQGLPPFIASLLLPVEITDGLSTQNLNNTTIKRCIGDSYQLTAQNITGTPIYKWHFNSIVVSTTATLNTGILSSASAGTYLLEIETTDICGFRISYKGEVKIEVYNPPTITRPADILECDTDTDGFLTINLNSLRDSQVLNTQSFSEFEVRYFKNQSDATTNTNAIGPNYTNIIPFGNTTLVARIQNIQNPSCFKTETFRFQVFEKPNPPATITNISVCDSNATGTDIDGFEIFNIATKQSEILNGQNPTNFTIKYFSDAGLTVRINNPSTYKNDQPSSQTIYVEITNNLKPDCEIVRNFSINVMPLPVIVSNYTMKQCDEDGVVDGFTNFNLNEANIFLTNANPNYTVTYYLSSVNAQNKIGVINPFSFSNATKNIVFARIENSNGCYRLAQVNLLVSATSGLSNYLKTVTLCDNDGQIDGMGYFNLSDYSAEIIGLLPAGQNLKVSYFRNFNDAQLETNEISQSKPYYSEVPFIQPIYIRVKSLDNGACFGLGYHLNLSINPRPEFKIDATAIYCENLPPIIIKPYNFKGTYTYEWFNQNNKLISTNSSAIISSGGTYTVIASSAFGCKSFPQTIVIKPSKIASLSYDDITVMDDSANNTITLATGNLGIGDYVFSLNDNFNNYQDSPFFDNLNAGIHTLFVKDKNNCGIAEIEVSVIGYPRFFTPNNDGINDRWKVLGVNENFYVNSNIFIFDRYGKLITQIDPKGDGWNGIFNGNFLPASDYWFSVELIDRNGNIKIKKGHFSLIRR
ncbi:T9SS type B sorting domain-containing protein [Lutibacter sp.]|uniref:T9SS type B sorting domain-containing protein n=1 Tax=Lutibacter sp. TaxID=1925666 RepID=UPI0027341222|nr:T9SS type B sorting domain-containing protein [Lutibacter sp.]MDP3312487.1 T9SS type B sorting domain-containing protein [Lutibacter sp.]